MHGILLIHGFLGNEEDYKPLTMYLQKQGYLVHTPTLAGHENLTELKYITATDYIEQIEQDYIKLRKMTHKITVIGYSLGGVLAVHLASKYPNIEKLILINAAFMYPDISSFLTNGHNIFREIFLQYRAGKRLDDLKCVARNVTANACKEVYKLIRNTRHDLCSVRQDTLILQSTKDGIVPPQTARYIYRRLATRQKEIMYLKNKGHILVEIFDTQFFQLINNFLNE